MSLACGIRFLPRKFSVLRRASGVFERSYSGNVALKCSLSSLNINTRLHFVGERSSKYSRYNAEKPFRHIGKKRRNTGLCDRESK
jgi:hypothetical protein